MFSRIKEKALSTGMNLLRSPLVAKAMESEQMGKVVEKALSFPIRISESIAAKKARLTAFLEVATAAEVEELKREIARLEDELRAVRQQGEQQAKDASA